MTNPLRSWIDRIKWGVRWGVVCAAVFAAFAIVLRVVDGPGSFDEHGTSLTRFLEAYAVAGLVGGVIVGLAKPILRLRAGSAGAGFVVGCLVGVTLDAVNGDFRWSVDNIFMAATFGMTGCLAGWLSHRKLRQMGKIPPT